MADHGRGHGNRESTLSPSDRWATAVVGLVLIASLVPIPFALAGPASLVSGVPYSESLATAVSVLAGVTEDYYEVLGVLATVLVALAAATNLGIAERLLGDRSRFIVLVCVMVCTFVIAALAACLIAATIAQPQRVVDAVVGCVVAWVCLLVAQTVTGAATAGERARSARKNWTRRKNQAAIVGINRKQVVRMWHQVIAEAVLWLGPLAIWVAIAFSITIRTDVPEASRGVLTLIAILLYYGNVVFTIGWRATSDLSDTRRARTWIRWFTGVAGMLASVLPALVMVVVLPVLGWAALIFSTVHLGLLMTLFERTSPGAVVQKAATTRALRRARASKILRERLAKRESTQRELALREI